MKLSNVFKACILGVSLLGIAPAFAAVPAGDTQSTAVRQVSQPLNINTADAATLAGSLKGIGQKKAEAIVAYRDEHGPFKSVDELVNVKGIGARTLEQLRPLVSL